MVRNLANSRFWRIFKTTQNQTCSDNWKMSEVSCLVHYGSIRTANNLTKVCEASFQTLLECKSISIRLGGEDSHDEQCSRIPESFEEK